MKQGSGMAIMKNGGWRYCSGWGINWMLNSLDDFSWTYRWHWDGLVALTPKARRDGGPMVIWPMNGITQPDSIMVMEWKCHAQEQPTTNKVLPVFFPFSPVISDQYLSIFVKLEDNICLFYNFPFGKTYHYVLVSPATVKLVLVWVEKFVAIFLTSLTTRITRSFSCLESLKRDEKETPAVLFRRIIPSVWKKNKIIQKGWLFQSL